MTSPIILQLKVAISIYYISGSKYYCSWLKYETCRFSWVFKIVRAIASSNLSFLRYSHSKLIIWDYMIIIYSGDTILLWYVNSNQQTPSLRLLITLYTCLNNLWLQYYRAKIHFDLCLKGYEPLSIRHVENGLANLEYML